MNVVYKTIPRHTEENIPLDQVIEIYFMIDMNKHSMRPENIILFNLTEQVVEPVTFEYSRRVLKVHPVHKLKPTNHYQLQLVGGESGLKDITGRFMAETYEVEFCTKDVENIKPPKILSPTDLSVVREAATFELEPSLNADYYELQVSKSNTFQNLVWPTNGEKVYQTSEIRVTPDIPYETGTYYMRVRAVALDGTASAWSPVIRFYYDGAPIIREPEEEPIPDETIPTQPESSGEETVSTQSVRKVILQSMSRLEQTPNQLSQLQKVFSAKADTTLTGLYVKSATPKDKSVNNPLANMKQIVIEFTDNIDPNSVTSTTCYVLAERN
jgi:hypothetical protein